jgi:hypothetical protein
VSELSDVVVLGIDKKDKYRLVWAKWANGFAAKQLEKHNQS